jgi:3-dehydroquinate dehydratase-1
MICVSLGKVSFETCQKILREVALAEIRLDLMPLSLAEVRRLFSRHPHLIATFRPGHFPEATRMEFLLAALTAGARYVDLDLESDRHLLSPLREKIKATHSRLIISYHNHKETPPAAKLRCLVREAFSLGADLVKIACFCRCRQDNSRLLSLVTLRRGVIVCGLGPLGVVSRVAAPLCGSPFTYAFWEGEEPTAAGQLSYQKLKSIYELLAEAFAPNQAQRENDFGLTLRIRSHKNTMGNQDFGGQEGKERQKADKEADKENKEVKQKIKQRIEKRAHGESRKTPGELAKVDKIDETDILNKIKFSELNIKEINKEKVNHKEPRLNKIKKIGKKDQKRRGDKE